MPSTLQNRDKVPSKSLTACPAEARLAWSRLQLHKIPGSLLMGISSVTFNTFLTTDVTSIGFLVSNSVESSAVSYPVQLLFLQISTWSGRDPLLYPNDPCCRFPSAPLNLLWPPLQMKLGSMKVPSLTEDQSVCVLWGFHGHSPSFSLLRPTSFSPGWKLARTYRFMRYSSLASVVLNTQKPPVGEVVHNHTHLPMHNIIEKVWFELVLDVQLLNLNLIFTTCKNLLHLLSLWIKECEGILNLYMCMV